jgi:hypothetical protein
MEAPEISATKASQIVLAACPVWGFRQSPNDTRTQLVMVMLPRRLRAAGMVMILASLGVAGDTPGIPANFDRAAAPPSCDDRPGQDSAALEMRRPYECGKVPVVFVHGLWGRPQLWERMVESLEACEAVLANNGLDAFTPGYLEEHPTSAGELAPGHPFLMGLCDLGIDSSVRSHSIIADLRNPPGPGATDGIVPYSSSHLEGVASELLVRGLHICLDHPAVIGEVRRILVEHAQVQPPSPTDHQAPRRLEKSQRLGLRYGVGGASEIQRGNPRGSLTEVQP